MKIRTENVYALGGNRHSIRPMFAIRAMTRREQAFRLAAWLVVLGSLLESEVEDPTEQPTFEQVLEAVRST